MVTSVRRRASSRWLRRGTGLLAAVALLASACGSDSDPEPDDAAGASTETDAPSEPATEGAQAGAYAPERPECIAPADPGGGWDFTCRSAAKLFEELGLVGGPMQVTNMPGGGGGVAFAHVIAERPDDEDLVVAASPSTTLRLAQGQYEGLESGQVRWLGAIGADFGVIAVAADAPYDTFDDLVEAWTADPSAIAIGGGSAVGGQDHMKVLLLAQAVGVPLDDVKYVPFDGGGEAMTAMLGGFIDVFPGDISESLGQLEAGNIKLLAALAPERLTVVPDVPTAAELGYDTEWIVWRGFYAPGGMSDDAHAYWTEALRTLEASPQWQQQRDDSGLGEFLLVGDEFTAFVERQVEDFETLSASVGLGG